MSSVTAKYLANFQYSNMKQQNRFIMFIDVIPAFYVRAASLPTLENNPVVVDTINSDYKIKGKSRWQPINVTLYDPIFLQVSKRKGFKSIGSGATLVWYWINSYHHDSRNDYDYYMDKYKQTVTISYLDPTGVVSLTALAQDKWVLHGAFCSSVNFGNLDVSSDDLVLIDLEITYDWAELQPSIPTGNKARGERGPIPTPPVRTGKPIKNPVDPTIGYV
jgi:hypothetical protein